MTSVCDLCKRNGMVNINHEKEECAFRLSRWCSQCGCYGHTPIECDEARHVYRPKTLEELIPEDLRERWDIDTETPIIWHAPNCRPITLEDAEREIADNNTIEVRYREGKQDSKIREVMRAYRIPTVHMMAGNIRKLREWAVSQGKKVCLIQEK